MLKTDKGFLWFSCRLANQFPWSCWKEEQKITLSDPAGKASKKPAQRSFGSFFLRVKICNKMKLNVSFWSCLFRKYRLDPLENGSCCSFRPAAFSRVVLFCVAFLACGLGSCSLLLRPTWHRQRSADLWAGVRRLRSSRKNSKRKPGKALFFPLALRGLVWKSVD